MSEHKGVAPLVTACFVKGNSKPNGFSGCYSEKGLSRHLHPGPLMQILNPQGRRKFKPSSDGHHIDNLKIHLIKVPFTEAASCAILIFMSAVWNTDHYWNMRVQKSHLHVVEPFCIICLKCLVLTGLWNQGSPCCCKQVQLQKPEIICLTDCSDAKIKRP